MAHSPNTIGTGEEFCQRMNPLGSAEDNVYEVARKAGLEIRGIIGGITVANKDNPETTRIVTLPTLYELAGLTLPKARQRVAA